MRPFRLASAVMCLMLACQSHSGGTPPVTLTVTPGTQQTVSLSRLHLNRIVTPFDYPQIKTIDAAEVSTEGPVVYLSSQQADPFVLYITPHDQTAHALTLLVTPTDMPPREIHLQLPGVWRNRLRRSRQAAQSWEEAGDYEHTLTQAMVAVARGEVPEGYELTPARKQDTSHCQQLGLVFDFSLGQRLVGHHFTILVGTVRNTLEHKVMLQEWRCRRPDVLAVAQWPGGVLLPGQRRELFVLMQADELESAPVPRPSLLRPGRQP